MEKKNLSASNQSLFSGKCFRYKSSTTVIIMLFLSSLFISFGTFLLFSFSTVAVSQEVVVETIQAGSGPKVTRDYKYQSMVTLYIEQKSTKSRTPSGWSTRKEDGADADKPFSFQPGKNLIQGWTEGVLKMKEGERALLHVPAAKGYGARSMGAPGGPFYIPGNSDLLFDIEILGKVPDKEF